MEKSKEPLRNQPAKEGKRHDPEVRDDYAVQPGVQTVSGSPYDKDNQQLSETAKDDFREDVKKDPNADQRFDEIEND